MPEAGNPDRLDTRAVVSRDLLLGLPAFVIPRPERVIETLITDRSFITHHLVATLQVSVLGLIIANIAGIGLAILSMRCRSPARR